MSDKQDEKITTADAARILHAHPATIRRWIKNEELPAVKHGRDWQIRRTDVEAFAKKREQYLQRESED